MSVLDLEMKKLRLYSQAWRTARGFKASVCATVVWGHRVGQEWAKAGLGHMPQ